MTPLVHLIASLIVGYIVAPNKRKFHVIVWVIALLCLAIDLDHYYLVGSMHNIWVLFSIPLMLYGIAYLYESSIRPWTITLRFTFLVLFLNNLLHLVLDSMDGSPLVLFYPFDNTTYTLSGNLGIHIGDALILSPAQTLLIGFIGLVAMMRFMMTRSEKRSISLVNLFENQGGMAYQNGSPM